MGAYSGNASDQVFSCGRRRAQFHKGFRKVQCCPAILDTRDPEEELGGQLFHRERANTRLSELGRIVMPHLQSVYDQTHAAKRIAVSRRQRCDSASCAR
jgi:hypothetical protein